MTVRVGLLVTLQAKPGKAQELAAFLEAGRALAQAEELTVTWYAFQIDESTYGIFDTFEGEEGRQAHLNGEIATALAKHGPDLLASDPDMRQVAILAAK
jgi:quinol monooxygenase YgiN